jgi:phage gp29-like protein
MGFKPTIKYIADTYGEGYEEKTAPVPNTTQGGTAPAQGQPGQGDTLKGTSNPAQFAEATDIDPTPVDAQTDLLANAAGPAIKSWVDTIRAKVEAADSLETLRDDLLNSYAELDSTELTKVMALAFAAADLSGQYDVSKGQ